MEDCEGIDYRITNKVNSFSVNSGGIDDLKIYIDGNLQHTISGSRNYNNLALTLNNRIRLTNYGLFLWW